MGGYISKPSNKKMVDRLVEGRDGYISSAKVEAVFRAVDRAMYFDSEEGDSTDPYEDSPRRWGNFHLSAPCIYAKVVEALELEPGLSFLNLGSGTGYLNTIIGLLVGPHGINHGIEFHGEVVEYARKRLKQFKLKSHAIDKYDFSEPIFVQGNCLNLNPNSKYDRIYLGAACLPDMELFMKKLIKPNGGILVMPFENYLMRHTRIGENEWKSEKLMDVYFTLMIGNVGNEGNNSIIIDMPRDQVKSLKELCRIVIRQKLRNKIESLNPNLLNSDNIEQRQRRRARKLQAIHMEQEKRKTSFVKSCNFDWRNRRQTTSIYGQNHRSIPSTRATKALCGGHSESHSRNSTTRASFGVSSNSGHRCQPIGSRPGQSNEDHEDGSRHRLRPAGSSRDHESGVMTRSARRLLRDHDSEGCSSNGGCSGTRDREGEDPHGSRPQPQGSHFEQSDMQTPAVHSNMESSESEIDDGTCSDGRSNCARTRPFVSQNDAELNSNINNGTLRHHHRPDNMLARNNSSRESSPDFYYASWRSRLERPRYDLSPNSSTDGELSSDVDDDDDDEDDEDDDYDDDDNDDDQSEFRDYERWCIARSIQMFRPRIFRMNDIERFGLALPGQFDSEPSNSDSLSDILVADSDDNDGCPIDDDGSEASSTDDGTSLGSLAPSANGNDFPNDNDDVAPHEIESGSDDSRASSPVQRQLAIADVSLNPPAESFAASTSGFTPSANGQSTKEGATDQEPVASRLRSSRRSANDIPPSDRSSGRHKTSSNPFSCIKSPTKAPGSSGGCRERELSHRHRHPTKVLEAQLADMGSSSNERAAAPSPTVQYCSRYIHHQNVHSPRHRCTNCGRVSLASARSAATGRALSGRTSRRLRTSRSGCQREEADIQRATAESAAANPAAAAASSSNSLQSNVTSRHQLLSSRLLIANQIGTTLSIASRTSTNLATMTRAYSLSSTSQVSPASNTIGSSSAKRDAPQNGSATMEAEGSQQQPQNQASSNHHRDRKRKRHSSSSDSSTQLLDASAQKRKPHRNSDGRLRLRRCCVCSHTTTATAASGLGRHRASEVAATSRASIAESRGQIVVSHEIKTATSQQQADPRGTPGGGACCQRSTRSSGDFDMQSSPRLVAGDDARQSSCQNDHQRAGSSLPHLRSNSSVCSHPTATSGGGGVASSAIATLATCARCGPNSMINSPGCSRTTPFVGGTDSVQCNASSCYSGGSDGNHACRQYNHDHHRQHHPHHNYHHSRDHHHNNSLHHSHGSGCRTNPITTATTRQQRQVHRHSQQPLRSVESRHPAGGREHRENPPQYDPRQRSDESQPRPGRQWNPPRGRNRRARGRRENECEKYHKHMSRYVGQLQLPQVLHAYLNYDRGLP